MAWDGGFHTVVFRVKQAKGRVLALSSFSSDVGNSFARLNFHPQAVKPPFLSCMFLAKSTSVVSSLKRGWSEG